MIKPYFLQAFSAKRGGSAYKYLFKNVNTIPPDSDEFGFFAALSGFGFVSISYTFNGQKKEDTIQLSEDDMSLCTVEIDENTDVVISPIDDAILTTVMNYSPTSEDDYSPSLDGTIGSVTIIPTPPASIEARCLFAVFANSIELGLSKLPSGQTETEAGESVLASNCIVQISECSDLALKSSANLSGLLFGAIEDINIKNKISSILIQIIDSSKKAFEQIVNSISYCSGLYAANTEIDGLDLSHISIEFANFQNTGIPAKFPNALSVSILEDTSFSGSLNVADYLNSDNKLMGLELSDIPNLLELNCSGTSLSMIGVGLSNLRTLNLRSSAAFDEITLDAPELNDIKVGTTTENAAQQIADFITQSTKAMGAKLFLSNANETSYNQLMADAATSKGWNVTYED